MRNLGNILERIKSMIHRQIREAFPGCVHYVYKETIRVWPSGTEQAAEWKHLVVDGDSKSSDCLLDVNYSSLVLRYHALSVIQESEKWNWITISVEDGDLSVDRTWWDDGSKHGVESDDENLVSSEYEVGNVWRWKASGQQILEHSFSYIRDAIFYNVFEDFPTPYPFGFQVEMNGDNVEHIRYFKDGLEEVYFSSMYPVWDRIIWSIEDIKFYMGKAEMPIIGWKSMKVKFYEDGSYELELIY